MKSLKHANTRFPTPTPRYICKCYHNKETLLKYRHCKLTDIYNFYSDFEDIFILCALPTLSIKLKKGHKL